MNRIGNVFVVIRFHSFDLPKVDRDNVLFNWTRGRGLVEDDFSVRLNCLEGKQLLRGTGCCLLEDHVGDQRGDLEIGEILDIPVGTVKSRMFHAVRKLQEALGGTR